MPSEESMKRALQAYVDGLNARDADAVIALFADEAEIEDPVGTAVKRGSEIEAWFRGAVRAEAQLELVAPIRASHGKSAAMAFTVTSVRRDGRYLTNSLDVAHFDERGKIVRLEGYWGPQDRRRLGRAGESA